SPAWQPAAPWIAVFLSVLMLWLAWMWLPTTPSVGSASTLVHPWVMPAAIIGWLIIAIPQVFLAQTAERRAPALLSAFGVLAIVAAWAALVLIYFEYGAWCLVSMMALIWCADIAAYFTGRAIGRRKLAPSVSPGKTWEGAVGGVVAAAVWTIGTVAIPG